MVRFSCEKALVQQAVAAVSRAVAAKSSIPALEGILLECGEDCGCPAIICRPAYAPR